MFVSPKPIAYPMPHRSDIAQDSAEAQGDVTVSPAGRTKRWRFVVPTLSVVFFLFVCAALGYRTYSVLTDPVRDPQAIEEKHFGMRDFSHTVYYPTRALLEGVNPYDSEEFRAHYPVRNFALYAPHGLILFLPIGMLEPVTAQVTWFILMAITTLGFTALVLRTFGKKPTIAMVFFFAALVLATRPGYQTMVNGQMVPLIALAFITMLRFGKEQPWLAGVALGFALIKPTIGVPMTVFMLCLGYWRSVCYGVGISAVLASGVFAVLARYAGGVEPLIESLFSMAGSHGGHENSNLLTTYSRVDLVLLVSRLLETDLDKPAQFAIGGATLALVGWVLTRIRYVPQHTRLLLATTLCAAGTLLFLYHQPYDMLLLTVPWIGLLLCIRDLRLGIGWLGLGLLLTVPLANYLATASGLRLLKGAPPDVWNFVTLINVATIVAATILCIGLILRRSESARPDLP